MSARTPSHTNFPTPSGGGQGPSRLGRYDLVQRIATGGMAEIFLALERGPRGLERRVVVKRILPHLAEHDSFVEMFLQEARIIARLQHPNIVQIYELGEDEGSYFIGMEYVPGSSFRELMRVAAKQKAELPFEVALGLVAQACAGAHAAHELTGPQGQPFGLVHRDISPHNLMVTSAGHVKLLDFGIAKATQMALDDKTRTGALKGKVHYMSPEQCRQEPLDRRSDVFALGIVLWELITARRLFKRDSELETMQAIVSGEVWDPREFRAGVPEPVVLAVMQALQVDKEARYKTAEEMRRAVLDAAVVLGHTADSDEIGPFVGELLGEQHQRTEELVQEALERTQAALDEGMDQTVLDRPPVELASGSQSGSRSGVGSVGSETLPPTPSPAKAGASAVLAAAENRGRAGVAAVFLVVAILVAGLAGTGIWYLRNLPPEVSGPPITIGWAQTIDGDLLRTELEPFRLYLERATGRPIRFVLTESYQDLSDGLLAEEIDFASMPPFIFLQTLAKNGEIHPVAVNLYDGASGNDGVLLALEGKGIRSVEDLKGKGLTWCYPDEDSTSGYALPRATMLRAGVDPDKDLKPHRSGNHLQTLRDMIDGVCDVGGTYSGNYLSASNAGVNVSRLRQIAITGQSPNDALVAAPEVPPAERELIGEAAKAFDAQRELGQPTIGDVAKISGFTDADLREWDDVRASLEAAGDLGAIDAEGFGHEAQDAGPPAGSTEEAPDAAKGADDKEKRGDARRRRHRRRR